MLNLKSFQVVQPDELLKTHLGGPLMNALFLESEDGIDWYAVQSRFQADTVKIAYDANGIIRQTVGKPDANGNYDVSLLVPINLSVAEIDADNYPAGVTLDGSWKFNEEIQVVYQDAAIASDLVYQRNLHKRDDLLAKCISYATAIQFSAARNTARTGDDDAIQALHRVADELRDVDLSAENPVWPEIPDFLNLEKAQ